MNPRNNTTQIKIIPLGLGLQHTCGKKSSNIMRFAKFISTDIQHSHSLQTDIFHVHGKDNYYMYWNQDMIVFGLINNMLQLDSL